MTAKASLAYGEFRIELEGTENFVSAHLKTWSEKIPSIGLSKTAPLGQAPSLDVSGDDDTGQPDAQDKKPRKQTRSGGPSCASRIRQLIDDDFFSGPKKANEIADRLKEKATPYESKHISAALIHTVQAGRLRRIKDGGVWTYVNP